MSKKHINYNLRAKKNIERKMFCDIFNKMKLSFCIENYIYVGMGSYFFTDFTLFHREFNIKKMISIEFDKSNADRYKFNRPFNNIEIEFKDSTKFLKELGVEKGSNHIFWLDYTDGFKNYMLQDMDILFRKILPGSFVAVSLNCDFEQICNVIFQELCDEGQIEIDDTDDTEQLSKVLNYFRSEKCENYFPEDIDVFNFGSNYKRILREVFRIRIEESILKRNKRAGKEKIEIEQVVFITYDDGTPMLTIGWVVVNEEIKSDLEKMSFQDLFFYSKDDKPYTIKWPILTDKEIVYLNSKFPLETPARDSLKGISHKLINEYHELYQHYPYFIERY